MWPMKKTITGSMHVFRVPTYTEEKSRAVFFNSAISSTVTTAVLRLEFQMRSESKSCTQKYQMGLSRQLINDGRIACIKIQVPVVAS
jgi:hypothetical protein